MSDRVEVTEHAIAMYRERIDQAATWARAATALRLAWRGATRLRGRGNGAALYAAEGGRYRLAVRVAPGRPPAILAVLPAGAAWDVEDAS